MGGEGRTNRMEEAVVQLEKIRSRWGGSEGEGGKGEEERQEGQTWERGTEGGQRETARNPKLLRIRKPGYPPIRRKFPRNPTRLM